MTSTSGTRPNRSPLKWFRLYTSPDISRCFRVHPVGLHSYVAARSFARRLSSDYVLFEGLPALPFLSTRDSISLLRFGVLIMLRKVRDSNPRAIYDSRVSGAVLSASQPTFPNMSILISLSLFSFHCSFKKPANFAAGWMF